MEVLTIDTHVVGCDFEVVAGVVIVVQQHVDGRQRRQHRPQQSELGQQVQEGAGGAVHEPTESRPGHG